MDGQLFNCNGKTYNTATLPVWARDLIASLERQRTSLHATIDRLEQRELEARQIISEGVEIHDRLVAALEEYADRGNWVFMSVDANYRDRWLFDEHGYHRARQALNKEGL
jgi:hypothetical protein